MEDLIHEMGNGHHYNYIIENSNNVKKSTNPTQKPKKAEDNEGGGDANLVVLREERRRIVNRNNYEKNKEKRKLQKILTAQKYNNGKWFCCCGDVITNININETDFYKTFIPHNKKICHKMFKSIISIIHSRRKNKSIQSIIYRLARERNEFKEKIHKEMPSGKMANTTNMTEAEIINFYNRRVNSNKYDENLFPLIKEPSINAIKYSDVGKLRLEILRGRKT